MVISPPPLETEMYDGTLVNTSVTFPPPVSSVTCGENRPLPLTSPPPVEKSRTPPRSPAVRLPPPLDTSTAPAAPETETSPPPLAKVAAPWMPPTCMLPPSLVRSTVVPDGTDRSAFSLQLPVGMRQSFWNYSPTTEKP